MADYISSYKPHAECESYALLHGQITLACLPCREYFDSRFRPDHVAFMKCSSVKTLENKASDSGQNHPG